MGHMQYEYSCVQCSVWAHMIIMYVGCLQLLLLLHSSHVSHSLGAVSNSVVGGHGSPLFPVSCSFDDLDFTDCQQLAEAFYEVQPWSSSASLALNCPSDYDVLKSMLSHDMSQETHLPRSDSVHQFSLCSSSPQCLIICDMVLPRYV